VFVEEFGNWGDNVSNEESKLFGSDKRGNNCIKALELFTNDTRKYFEHNRNISFVNGLKKQIEGVVATTISIFGAYGNDLYTFAKIILENSNDIAKIKSWELNKNKICEILKEHTNNGDIQNAPSKDSFYSEVLGCYMVNGLDSTRFFTKADKQVLYSALIDGNGKGKKLCANCKKEFTFDEFEIDHILAWSKGGRTELKNAQLLCKRCNASKGGK
jgi:hypothetical protein